MALRNIFGAIRIAAAAFCLILGALPAHAQQRVDLEGLKGGITAGTVTCAVTATAVPTTALSGRRSIAIINISDADIFVGPSTVTTANGYQLGTDVAISLDVTNQVTVYCLSAAGGKEARYLEAR